MRNRLIVLVALRYLSLQRKAQERLAAEQERVRELCAIDTDGDGLAEVDWVLADGPNTLKVVGCGVAHDLGGRVEAPGAATPEVESFIAGPPPRGEGRSCFSQDG